MNKILARCIFAVASGVCIVLSIAEPWVLGDQNSFLKDFVNHELLGFLGVIVAITLASAANLHLEFNNLEDKAQTTFLSGTRAAVRRSAYWMIAVFAFSVVLVVAKPLVGCSDIATSFVNGIALLVVLFNILVLTDLTQLVFRIEPVFKIVGKDGK